MSIVVSNMNVPSGCQKCRFFKKHLFGNGLDYSYSCILGAKDFPMPWIRQMEERASDCPIKSLEQEPKTEQFAKWVAKEIFDDNWEYNKESFAELACRKLAKLGIVIRMGDEWELVEPQESEE